MLEELRKRVCEANLRLVVEGLVFQTWGNVSGIDRSGGYVVIKPSGLDYRDMKPEHMVVVSLADGSRVEGNLNPSSDTPTHLELYRAFDRVGGVVHTHSTYATAWAQARRALPVLGTTHADHFHGPVPCTRAMSSDQIEGDYEANVGKTIVERFEQLDPTAVPGVLVCAHGPFCWGEGPEQAVANAVILEHLARLAYATLRIDPYPKPLAREMLDRHFLRKHGPDAYYGQKGQ